MRFRGEIETARVPGLLLVPREAVFLRDAGPVVWRKTRLGWRETGVTLGRSNRTLGRGGQGPLGRRAGEPERPRAGRPRRGRARRPRGADDEAAAASLAARHRGRRRRWRCSPRARLVRSIEPESVASFEVRPGRFVREVEARGTLKAVKATPIVVPLQSRRSQKIALLVPDGALLKAGEVVVEFDPYDARARGGRRRRPTWRPPTRRSTRRRRTATRTSARLPSTATWRRRTSPAPRQYKLTDERLYSRNQIIESRLEPRAGDDAGRGRGQAARGERAALGGRPGARRDRRHEGQLQAGHGAEEPAPRCGSWRRTTACWCSSGTGAARSPSSATRCGRDRRSARSPT